jgi:hypothetical protein
MTYGSTAAPNGFGVSKVSLPSTQIISVAYPSITATTRTDFDASQVSSPSTETTVAFKRVEVEINKEESNKENMKVLDNSEAIGGWKNVTLNKEGAVTQKGSQDELPKEKVNI